MSESSILDRIVQRKREEIAAAQSQYPLSELCDRALARRDQRGFVEALRRRMAKRQPAVIAEIKKASPSQGVIREDFDPPRIAGQYAEAGAACLSVLTDESFFQGSARYLQQAREACELPVLRKDFVIDPYQVAESAAMGADCLLLIVAILSPVQLRELAAASAELGVDVLVEVHDESEMDVALDCGFDLIGINNRNLHDFSTSLDTTFRLAARAPQGTLIVTESGIHERADVELMLSRGILGFLVGESMMRADDPGQRYRELFRQGMTR
ncbi:MAG: indole-3-glycerol phosphate synthase TrpC [Pseudohongiellaceae bacterium]